MPGISFKVSITDHRIAVKWQSENSAHSTLNFVEPVTGLFHLQMSVLQMLFRTHMATSESLNSMTNWMTILRRDTNMWEHPKSKKRGKIKNFRACDAFLNHVLDGYILAFLCTYSGVDTMEGLCQSIETTNWRHTIKEVETLLSHLSHVGQWRKQPESERDLAFENAVLFIQHAMMYRDLSEAIRSGDSGRIEHCLQFLTIWYQASDEHNYARETIHLIACLRALWSQDLRQAWRDQCVVNISGSPRGFLAADMACEHVLRAIKDLIHHNNTPATDKYVRTVIAPNIMVLREVRNKFYYGSGATQNYKHSSTVTAWYDVTTVALQLMRCNTFVRTPGRNMSIMSAPDLHTIGSKVIGSGCTIDAYKDAMQNGMYYIPWDQNDDGPIVGGEDNDLDEMDKFHGYMDDDENY